MSVEETALTQSRQIMMSKMPEYRPFSLGEIVRAAKLDGGASAAPQVKKRFKLHTRNALGLPEWLDIFLYCTLTFVVGAAVFMGLYVMWVQPYKQTSASNLKKSGFSLPPNVETLRLVHETKPAAMKAQDKVQDRLPPHPPPPMLPLAQ